MIFLAFVLGILVPGLSRSADATVVENPDHGVWDDAPRQTFQILEELVLGSEQGDDAFGRIADVAVDSRGRWIVLDDGLCRVQVYDPDEMSMKTIGRRGGHKGVFSRPTAIGVDGEDRIYVVEQGGRVSVFAPDGEARDSFPLGLAGLSTRIRITPTGIYVSCFDPAEESMVHRYDRQHVYMSSFSDAWSMTTFIKPDERPFSCSGAIDIDPEGNVIYTQMVPYEIRKFSPEGNLLLTIRRQHDFLTPPTFERTADGINVHGHGGSVGVLALPGGRILNVAVVHRGDDMAWPATCLDLFDTDGRLLKSRRIEGAIGLRCLDASGRAYAIVTDPHPQVIRYRLEIP